MQDKSNQTQHERKMKLTKYPTNARQIELSTIRTEDKIRKNALRTQGILTKNFTNVLHIAKKEKATNARQDLTRYECKTK